MKGWEKIFQANGPPEQAGIAVIISDKIDLRLKSVRRDNEGHFILIKRTIHQEEIIMSIILNIYVPNFDVSNVQNPTGLQSTDGPQHSDSGRTQIPRCHH
jgi:hypothetical protein